MTPLRPVSRRALAAQSDDRLVRLLRDGHEPAFEEIVRRYRGPLIAFTAAIVTTSRAEDVVQAALERAHASLLADEREISLRSWLFTIARNGALNLIRDEPRWSELDPDRDGEQHPAAIVEQREELNAMVAAICALPESQRQALVMREMEGAGHAEIAAKLHTSPQAVRGLIFRARTALRDGAGALIPLPIMRWLLMDATAAGTVAAGAGGTSGALLAGGAGKVGVAVVTAVVAVGAGKAIQDRRGDDVKQGPETAIASPPQRAAGEGGASKSAAGGSASGPGEAREQDSPGDSQETGGGNEGGEGSGPDRGGGTAGGGGTRSEDRSGSDAGRGSGGEVEGDTDSSGPGGGGSDSAGPGSGGSDSSGSGSGGSGSSGSGSDSSGSDSSGSGPSGSGSDDPDPVQDLQDSSGSGSSGSG